MSYTDDWVYPGMIVTMNHDGRYAPWSPDGKYGNNYPRGVLREPISPLSPIDPTVIPITSGRVIERYCYEKDKEIGKISHAVKRFLDRIEWV